MKTAVLPGHETRLINLDTGAAADDETRLRAVVAPAPKTPRWRRLAVGAAASCLLLIVGAAAGVYVYQPHARRTQKAPAGAVEEVKAVSARPPENTAPVSSETNATGANVLTVPANTASEPVKESVAKTEPRPPVGKMIEVPKDRNKAPRAEVEAEWPEDFDEETLAADDEPGETIGAPPKNPQTGQPIPPFVWRKMSPEERRRLRQALELQRQQIERKKREEGSRRKKPPLSPVPPPYR